MNPAHLLNFVKNTTLPVYQAGESRILVYFNFFITVTESLKIFGIDETVKDLIVVVFQDESQEKIKTIQVKLVSYLGVAALWGPKFGVTQVSAVKSHIPGPRLSKCSLLS